MKTLPFSSDQIRKLAREQGIPFYVYDERGIRAAARKLIDSFSWNTGFKEYFAVKATPNPEILKILGDERCGVDCSSMVELLLAQHVGLHGENIMFSSNMTPREEFVRARALGAIINLDDVAHLKFMERHAGLPDLICVRYNPSALRCGNEILGLPTESKFGMTKAQVFDAYSAAREKGVRRYGLHTMPISNELRADCFVEVARIVFELCVGVRRVLGIELEFINLGGGWGIPYRPCQSGIDAQSVSGKIRDLYRYFVADRGMPAVKLFMECGRYITGPHGYLVSTVRHVKETYKRYVGLDACMANLMRPGMYESAYHHLPFSVRRQHRMK